MNARALFLGVFGFTVVSSCVPPSFGECLGTAIGQAVGTALGEGFARAFGGPVDVAAPDRFAETDAGTFVSVAHLGGRLEFQFSQGLSTGRLPKSDSSCLVTDFAVLRDRDGGREYVYLNVVEASRSPVDDGGVRVRLECRELSRHFADGGTEAMADRSIDFVSR